MVDLSKRSYQEEIMDDLSDGSESLYRALQELDIINKWLGGNAVTLHSVKKMLLANTDKVWHIADLGCGSGEMLVKIAHYAREHHFHVKLYGFDANENIIRYARQHCAEYPEIEFHADNILDDSFKSRQFDLILCTLFLHHFTDDQLATLLPAFRKQSPKVLINDLHRHWFAYYSIKWITKFFSKSPMVQNDACLSVWRSFKKSDWRQILKTAGITNYSIGWRWAFRWKVVID